MFFCVWYFKKDQIKKFSIAGIGLLIVLVFFQGGMVTFRADGPKDISSALQGINASKDNAKRSLLKEVDYRFGSLTRYSVGFFRMVDREYTAGLTPILNSAYSPIPRRFMPDKPVPCSVDGDIYGMGMYKTTGEITGNPYMMCEFSTAAHAYWELNIFGVILFSIIPAIYVFLSIRFFRKFDLLGPCFFMAVFKPWGYNDPKIWVSEIVLQLSQVIFVSWLLICIYERAKKWFVRKRRVVKRKYSV